MRDDEHKTVAQVMAEQNAKDGTDGLAPVKPAVGQWWQFGGEPYARRVTRIADDEADLEAELGSQMWWPRIRMASIDAIDRARRWRSANLASSQWQCLGFAPQLIEAGQRWLDPHERSHVIAHIVTCYGIKEHRVLFDSGIGVLVGELVRRRDNLHTSPWQFCGYERDVAVTAEMFVGALRIGDTGILDGGDVGCDVPGDVDNAELQRAYDRVDKLTEELAQANADLQRIRLSFDMRERSGRHRPFMKLPLQRMPYSGSTSSWIADADGNDIARCSCGRCKCGEQMTGVVAFPDKVAQAIVDAVNTDS